MNKNKGQALVEFIIIIPVFIFITMGMVDFGNILYQKYQLENQLDFVTELYQQNKLNEINTYVSNKNISFTYDIEGAYATIMLSKLVDVMTPGLNLVLGENYNIEVNRVVYNEQP